LYDHDFVFNFPQPVNHTMAEANASYVAVNLLLRGVVTRTTHCCTAIMKVNRIS